MKAIGALLLIAIMLGGCATVDYSALEARLVKLEKAKASDTMLLAEQAGARKFWWRNDVIGGGDALDGINNALLTDGDCALVGELSGTTATGSWWVYDSDGTNSDSPGSCTDATCIRVAPDTGGGAWHLITIKVQGMTGIGTDGYNYWQAYNATGFSGTPAEGYCYWKDSDDDICCYDADTTAWLCHSFD